MSWVPAEQVLKAADAQRQASPRKSSGSRASPSTTRPSGRSSRTSAARRCRSPGAAVPPKLDEASIAAAAKATGLIGLPFEKIPEKLEGRRSWLLARLGEIARHPSYANPRGCCGTRGPDRW